MQGVARDAVQSGLGNNGRGACARADGAARGLLRTCAFPIRNFHILCEDRVVFQGALIQKAVGNAAAQEVRTLPVLHVLGEVVQYVGAEVGRKAVPPEFHSHAGGDGAAREEIEDHRSLVGQGFHEALDDRHRLGRLDTGCSRLDPGRWFVRRNRDLLK